MQLKRWWDNNNDQKERIKVFFQFKIYKKNTLGVGADVGRADGAAEGARVDLDVGWGEGRVEGWGVGFWEGVGEG